MENYIAERMPKDSNYDFIIFATNCENPVNDMLVSGCEFLKTGKIVFDLALINGLKNNRFIEAEVIENRLIFDSIRHIPAIAERLNRFSRTWFKNNSDIVERSALSAATKFHLTHCIY